MDIIQVTCALILNDRQQVLVVQRSAQMKLPLKWEFPGGKIEAGETAAACLIREIKEELQLNIQIQERRRSHVHHYPAFSIELIPFTATIISGNIHLLEHAQYQWAAARDLINFDWAEADLPIVKDYLGS